MLRIKIALLVGLLGILGIFGVMIWESLSGKKASTEKRRSMVSRVVPTDEVTCLARNLAYETLPNSHKNPEARRELEAIMHVVFERRRLGRRAGYRNTTCEVIYQRAQFSWTLKRALRYAIPRDRTRWKYMQAVARDGLADRFQYAWPSTHRWVVSYKRAANKHVGRKPAVWFRKRMRPVAVIGEHQFYCAKKKMSTTKEGSPKRRA